MGIGEFRSEFHVTAHLHEFYEIGLVLEGTHYEMIAEITGLKVSNVVVCVV